MTNRDIEMKGAVEKLAAAPASVSVSTSGEEDQLLVTFLPSDHRNPLNWSSSRKWAVTSVLSATGFSRIMISTIMAPALSTIAKDLHMNSVEAVMALSIYLLGTAFGPLIISPLSELYGRRPVLHASNVWFLAWNMTCGFAPNKGVLIASRFFAGLGASAVYTLAGGVLGDIWTPQQRGKSLGIYVAIPVIGGAVGPIIGGFMTARTSWRWMFWATSIFQAVMIICAYFIFPETYAPCILRKEANRLRQETGDQRYQSVQERRDANSLTANALIIRALSRPIRLLLTHPIIQIASAISAFQYGLLYIVLSSFASVWTQEYNESVEVSGLHYIAVALGHVVGSQVGGPLMDRLFLYMRSRSPDTEHVPEFRIPLSFLGATIGPLGLLIYGWTVQYRVHWSAVDTGIFIAMFASQIEAMPLTAYVIDAYSEHVSSALAALQFFRSLTAFLFPLFTPAMYRAMGGLGWGNTFLAAMVLLVGIPFPLIIYYKGAKMRAKATSSL